MKKANKNIETGRKLFALRDTINDKLYASIVEVCRQEEVDISIEKCQSVVRHCQGQVSKLFEVAVTQILASIREESDLTQTLTNKK
jgi:hypothetical protein